jgi:hypothetical protein
MGTEAERRKTVVIHPDEKNDIAFVSFSRKFFFFDFADFLLTYTIGLEWRVGYNRAK